MPPLPARQPFRMQLLQQKRRRQVMGLIHAEQFEAEAAAAAAAAGAGGMWQSPSNLRLPRISSERLVSFAGLKAQNDLTRFDLLANKESTIASLPPLLS